MAVLAVLSLGPDAGTGVGSGGPEGQLAAGVASGTPPGLDPLDLALVRGEAVFEAMRVHGGRPFRLRAHLARLAASAGAVDLPLPGGLEDLAGRAVAAAGGGDAVLRLICTKGPEGTGAGGPAAFAICTDIPATFEEERRRGLRLVLLTTATDPLLRAASPWLLPGVKTI
ncbi:MAG: aminotransferase class IV, partial [Actinomycetes bacterium]